MASITLTWTAASPTPANGYRIKYWPTDTPSNISTISPNPIASPYTITGVTDNTNYTGTIEASCEGAAYSTAVSWSITPVSAENITIEISLEVASSSSATATGLARLYTSSDGTNYTVASSILDFSGASQSVTPIPGNWYYLQVTKLTCTGNNCGYVRPQAAWTIDGQTYGPNTGGVTNNSTVTSDPIQIATSGNHSYLFNGYVDYLL